jgi:hypothetical protein
MDTFISKQIEKNEKNDKTAKRTVKLSNDDRKAPSTALKFLSLWKYHIKLRNSLARSRPLEAQDQVKPLTFPPP